MRRLLIAGLIALVGSAAQAETTCVTMEDTSDSGGIFALMSIPGQQPLKMEYGGSLATGTGISQWFQVNGPANEYPALEDHEAGTIEWDGRIYRRCK